MAPRARRVASPGGPGLPSCSTRPEQEPSARPERLAHPYSPPPLTGSRSPVPASPRCARRPYLRAQPRGTATARAGPQVAVLRLLQAASPGRGGSGRAGGAVPPAELLRVARPSRAEAALVTPAPAGGSARSRGERAGPGGAGVGLGPASGADPTRPRARAAGGRATGGRGDEGAALPRPLQCPLPWPAPGSTPATFAACGRLHQNTPWSSPRIVLPAGSCRSAHFARRTRGSESGWRGGGGDSDATSSRTRIFEFSLNPGVYTSNPRPQSHLVPKLHAAGPISPPTRLSDPPPPPPTKGLKTLAPPLESGCPRGVTSAPRTRCCSGHRGDRGVRPAALGGAAPATHLPLRAPPEGSWSSSLASTSPFLI